MMTRVLSLSSGAMKLVASVPLSAPYSVPSKERFPSGFAASCSMCQAAAEKDAPREKSTTTKSLIKLFVQRIAVFWFGASTS